MLKCFLHHFPIQIYLSHNQTSSAFILPANVEQVIGVQKIDGDDIILKDKSIVHADVIILATGYR